MIVDVLDKKGKKSSTLELPKEFFGVRWNADAVHQVINSYVSNSRQLTAHAKNRGEVSGGGKKPWRQKGTGKARHGSSRSPIWVGGGVTFGPRNERNFDKKINKKLKKFALYSVLSRKMKEGEILIFEDFQFTPLKTKSVADFMKENKISQSVLFVRESSNTNFSRVVSNIPKTKVVSEKVLNAYECMGYKKIIFEKEAIISFAQLSANENK